MMGVFIRCAILGLGLGALLWAQESTPPVPPAQPGIPVVDPQDQEKADAEKAKAEKEKEAVTPESQKKAESETKADALAAGQSAPDQTNETTVVEPAPGLLPNATGGPPVLSRPFEFQPLENADLRLRPYFSISAITDDGLTTGSGARQQDYGLETGFGIGGTRQLRGDILQLDFHGDVQRYDPNTSFNGGTYSLNLRLQHQLSRHMYLVLSEAAGYYSNSYSLVAGPTDLATESVAVVATPNTTLFNNSSYNFSTGADLVIQKTARLSFDIGATGSEVKRESSALFGDVAATVRLDMNYRFTRRLTAGLFYNYSHYEFVNEFGGSQVNGLGFLTSYRLSRSLQVHLKVGVSQVNTTGDGTFTLDPAIAAILGTSTGIEVIHPHERAPDFSAQLAKSYRTGTASLEYLNSVTPGNGITLTSKQSSVTAHYEYIGVRRWVFTVGGGEQQLSSLGLGTPSFKLFNAQMGVSRVLQKGLQANFTAQLRHYDITGADFLRTSYRIVIGLAWTPGERPLKLW